MTTENDALAINAANQKARRYDLERLIEASREENQHSEIDWGPASGNEASVK